MLDAIIKIRPDKICNTKPPVRARAKPPPANGMNQAAVCIGVVCRTVSTLELKVSDTQMQKRDEGNHLLITCIEEEDAKYSVPAKEPSR